MGTGLDGVGLEMAVHAEALAGGAEQGEQDDGEGIEQQQRRCGSLMRAEERPMPKRRSLVSRKLGSTPQRFEYSAMICGAVALPSLATRHQGSFMPLAFTHTTAPTGHCASVTVASRSLRAWPPWPTHSAAGRIVPSAALTLVLPFSRMT